MTVDADTLLHREALRRLVSRLESAPADTVAVAGAVMIRNSRVNLLTRMQEWDYFLGIAAVKRMQGLYQRTLVAQGASRCTAPSRCAESEDGPTRSARTSSSRGGSWRAASGCDFEPTAVAFTDAPTQVSHFMRQRARLGTRHGRGIRTVPPWRQSRVLSRLVAGIDLMIPLLDIGYALICLPGLVLVGVGYPVIVGVWTLSCCRSRSWSTEGASTPAAKVFGPLGLRVRRNPLGYLAFLLVYQALCSAASLVGYAQEIGAPTGAGSSRYRRRSARSDDPLRSASRPRPRHRAWLDLAKQAEDSGFDTLYVADHLGATASPFAALTAAAPATSTLRIGTYVLNVGIRDPLAIASDAATLDVLSERTLRPRARRRPHARRMDHDRSRVPDPATGSGDSSRRSRS